MRSAISICLLSVAVQTQPTMRANHVRHMAYAKAGSSPPELIARLLLSELANAARGETDQKRNDRKRMEAEQLAS